MPGTFFVQSGRKPETDYFNKHSALSEQNGLMISELFTLPLCNGISVDVKGMVMRSEIIQLTGGLYYFTYPRIAELDHFTGFNINKMVVLTALISPFKLSYVLTKLVFDDQVTVEQ